MNKIGIAACFAVLALGFGMATADDSTVIPGTDPAHITGRDDRMAPANGVDRDNTGMHTSADQSLDRNHRTDKDLDGDGNRDNRQDDNKDAAALYASRCRSCHGADGNRVAAQGTASLDGQSQEELMHKLKGYKNGTYGGARKEVMVNVVDSLNEAQLKELSDYIPTL